MHAAVTASLPSSRAFAAVASEPGRCGVRLIPPPMSSNCLWDILAGSAATGYLRGTHLHP
jgi:hypothetical protein